MLVKWVSFLSSLHWLAGECDLGVGDVSYVELLILYELWAGERLELEKAVPRYRRPGRSISVSAVPFGPGTGIWRSCGFLGALFRGLRDLPFGLRRFVPCDIGANHCRLRHIGWERCGHGLTSRPRVLIGVVFVIWLLIVLMVLGFLVVIGWVGICFLLLLVVLVILLMVGFWETLKEFDSTEKHQANLARVGNSMNSESRSRVWKRLRVSRVHWCPVCDSHVLHECHHSGNGSSLGHRVGVG